MPQFIAQDKFRCDFDYKRYQRKLLYEEIDCKRLLLSIVRESNNDYRRKIENKTYFLNFTHYLNIIDETNDRKIDDTGFNHSRKWFNLELRKKHDSLS